MTKKNFYDGRTPHEDYPIDIGIECFSCKYNFDCFSDNANKTHRCLIEKLEREDDGRE